MNARRWFSAFLLLITMALFAGCGSTPSGYTLSSLTPSEIVAGSNDFVLLVSGSNFKPDTKVIFGATTLTPTPINRNILQVLVPRSAVANAGIIDVAVTGSPTSAPLKFTINNPVPSVSTLSKPEVLLNSTSVSLDVTGSNFVATSTVKLGELSLKPTNFTATRLTVSLPDTLLNTAQVVNLSVANPGPGGGASNAVNFSVLNPVPVISALSLEEAALNSADLELAITGTGFARGMRVGFGAMTLEPTDVSATRATVVIPRSAMAKAAIHNVTVANGGPGGGTSNAHKFTVKNPGPSLASLSVTKTLVGSEDLPLNLTGAGFISGESVVQFGSLTLTPASTSMDQLSVVVPKAAFAQTGTVSVKVSTGEPGGGQSNALEFTIENPAPVLTALSLNSVEAGSAAFELSLTGSNFVPGSTVEFGGAQLNPSEVSGSRIMVPITAERLLDAGDYPITVRNPGPGGGTSSAIAFTVHNPVPTLTSLSPDKVIRLSKNAVLTLAGTGFVHQSRVQFGGASLEPSSFSPTAITVAIPSTAISRANPVEVRVENPGPGGGSSAGLSLSVANPRPQLLVSSPTSISTNSNGVVLALNGDGFNDDTVVTMTSASSGTVTVPTDAIEEKTIHLTIPSIDISNAGTLAFTATNPTPGGGDSETITVVVRERAQTAWRTVVNNKMVIPGSSEQLFNSYNQPSISNTATVVFKSQSKGQSGPIVGVYTRDMSGAGQPIRQVTAKGEAVPPPNNTVYNGSYAGFNEFPSFPRIDLDTAGIAFRGQSRPVWTYTSTDGLESRLGSAGIYSTAGGGDLKTAVGLLGSLPDFEYFKVPSAGGTRFDQFPGSPAIYHNTIVFKGNYTVGDTGKTGVYFRDLLPNSQSGSENPVIRIADSDTLIPGQPEGGVVFGSTAPPSAADNKMVFVGLDNEDEPKLGGIYLAPLTPDPALTTLISVGRDGTQVPGEAPGVTFNRLGEGLSFDGRFVAFWAAWGPETRTRTLVCGVDGNQEMLDACRANYPDGFSTEIPVHQGIFVYDTQATEDQNPLQAIVKTDAGEFTDFLYWVFSGRPPSVGGSESGSGSGGEGGDAGDGGTGPDVVPEPPRWRSSAFVAVQGLTPGGGPDTDLYRVAFKAVAGTSDGVYLAHSSDPSRIQTIIDTTFAGGDIDSEAPSGSLVTAAGLERDGLRNGRLVLTSSMLNSTTTESNAGVYLTDIQALSPPPRP